MSASSISSAQTEPYSGVVLRAVLWLALLAPFFYLSYGFANWLASQRSDVGSIVFSWERQVPFVAWTIVPYWSINLFYGLSLLLNDTKRGVDRLAGRYLTAQLVAVGCFIAFPLTATFVRPQTDGLPGFMFAVLGGFDKPFNQAPSLHIALLVIIWDHWRGRLGGAAKLIWHIWCFLIGASVLTTWQHHFIDIPTGALLGFFALWLFPAKGPTPFGAARVSTSRKALKLAFFYAAGAVLLLAAAWIGTQSGSPSWLVLLWPSLALAIVAFGYAAGGVGVFQKRPDGSVSLASRVLLWPYRVGARANVWAWTRKLKPSAEIADGVFLGRFPTARMANGFDSVVDLSAEFEKPAGVTARWTSLPTMDLLPPSPPSETEAAAAIEQARREGTVLVSCALGFQRSASAVAAWLVSSGRATDARQAAQILQATGRPVHLAPAGGHRMSAISYQRAANSFAKTLATRAAMPFLFVAILWVYMPPAADLMLGSVAKAILLGAAAAGCVALLLSAYLLFDAALFLMMSRYPDEGSGGAAVDALLARMKLRSMPERTRTLAERIEGTSRFLPLQRTALTAAVASTALTLFLSGTQ